jgi:hypothetical protein
MSRWSNSWPRRMRCLRFLVVLGLAGVIPAAWGSPVAVLAQEDPGDRETPGMAADAPPADDSTQAPAVEDLPPAPDDAAPAPEN